MEERQRAETAHELIAFSSGRQALPCASVQRSDILQRVVSVSSACITQSLPRGALALWSVYVRHSQRAYTLDDLCMIVRVADFLADTDALSSAGAELADRLLQEGAISSDDVDRVLYSLTENQALAVLRAHACTPQLFKAYYLKQPQVLMQHPNQTNSSFRPLHQLLAALPATHGRLALLAHTPCIEATHSLHISMSEPDATLQALRIAASHFHNLTAISFRPLLPPPALHQALLCACSLPNLSSLNFSGMHVTQIASKSIAGALNSLPSLKMLNVSSCGLHGDAAAALFNALHALGGLEELVVRHNDLQVATAHALASQFVHLKHLHSLDVAFTRLCAAASQQIVSCIHQLQSLRMLDMRGNPLYTASSGAVLSGVQQGLPGGAIRGAAAFGAAHILPLGVARNLICQLAALPNFEKLLLDQHRRITHAGHMHASASPRSHPPDGAPPSEPGLGLLTALFEMQPYMQAAYFEVDLDPSLLQAPPSPAHSPQYMHAHSIVDTCSHSMDTRTGVSSLMKPRMDCMHAPRPTAPLSYLTELQLHLVRLSGQGAALASGLGSLSNLQGLKVTLASNVVDNELAPVVCVLSRLQRLTLLTWHHEGGRGTVGYAGSFSEALHNLPDLCTVEFDFALESACHAGVVGDAFRSLRKLSALHLGFCTEALMHSLSPLLPANLQHMSINGICERSGLPAFCMHAPRLNALNSLSLAGQGCGDADLHALAAYLPQLTSLTMLYITLLRTSVTVEETPPPHPGTLRSSSVPCVCMADADSESDDSDASIHPLEDTQNSGEPPVHVDHALASDHGNPGGCQGSPKHNIRVAALEAVACSIGLLPRLQSLRLGLDVWTPGMASALFEGSGACMQHQRNSPPTNLKPGQLAGPAQLEFISPDITMHGDGGAAKAPPAHLTALSDVNFFLPLGPSFRLPAHRSDALLPPCDLFTHALRSCSHLEALEAEHFVLTRDAVATLQAFTVLPRLLVLDLQAMHMTAGVARQLARALHTVRLPCLSFLRLDIITAVATHGGDGHDGKRAPVGGPDADAISFGLVGDSGGGVATGDTDSEDEGCPCGASATQRTMSSKPPIHALGAYSAGSAPRHKQFYDSELSAIVQLLPPLPSLVTLHLTSRRGDRVGWQAAVHAWRPTTSAQRLARAKRAELFSYSLSAVLRACTRLQTLHVSTSQLPDSALHAATCLAQLPALTELCLGESTCGAATAKALSQKLHAHTALADVKLTGLRLKDPGAYSVAQWLRRLPALREVTLDNVGLCPDGCLEVDRLITDLQGTVKFTQQALTCVYGDSK